MSSFPSTTSTPSWALTLSIALDLNGSRGITADIAAASILKRQVAFAVLASVELDNPRPFLSRLGCPDLTIGEAIRKCRGRDLIAATFGVDTVPSGYLRALIRLGEKPLSEPHLYSRLFYIYRDATEERKAYALRYCGDKLSDVKIRAVDVLDPVLLEPEIVKHLHHHQEAHQANALLRFVRECSTASDQTLVTALRQTTGWGGLAGVARRFLKKADRFPPPPLRWDPDIRYLDSGAALCSLALELRNCLGERIAEVLLGFRSYYAVQTTVAGASVPVVIELSPLSNGSWKIDGLYGPKNKPIPLRRRKVLVEKLLRMGAVVEAHPATLHPEAKVLVEPLNVHRWNDLLPLEDKAAEPPDDVMDLVLDEIDREFGLT